MDASTLVESVASCGGELVSVNSQAPDYYSSCSSSNNKEGEDECKAGFSKLE